MAVVLEGLRDCSKRAQGVGTAFIPREDSCASAKADRGTGQKACRTLAGLQEASDTTGGSVSVMPCTCKRLYITGGQSWKPYSFSRKTYAFPRWTRQETLPGTCQCLQLSSLRMQLCLLIKFIARSSWQKTNWFESFCGAGIN